MASRGRKWSLPPPLGVPFLLWASRLLRIHALFPFPLISKWGRRRIRRCHDSLLTSVESLALLTASSRLPFAHEIEWRPRASALIPRSPACRERDTFSERFQTAGTPSQPLGSAEAVMPFFDTRSSYRLFLFLPLSWIFCGSRPVGPADYFSSDANVRPGPRPSSLMGYEGPGVLSILLENALWERGTSSQSATYHLSDGLLFCVVMNRTHTLCCPNLFWCVHVDRGDWRSPRSEEPVAVALCSSPKPPACWTLRTGALPQLGSWSAFGPTSF